MNKFIITNRFCGFYNFLKLLNEIDVKKDNDGYDWGIYGTNKVVIHSNINAKMGKKLDYWKIKKYEEAAYKILKIKDIKKRKTYKTMLLNDFEEDVENSWNYLKNA